MKLNHNGLLSQTDSLKGAIDSFSIPYGLHNEVQSTIKSLNESLTQVMGLNNRALLSQTDSFKFLAENATKELGSLTKIYSNDNKLNQALGLNTQSIFKQINSMKSSLDALVKPYGHNNTLGLLFQEGQISKQVESIRNFGGYENILKQTIELNGQTLLFKTDSINRAIESFSLPHEFNIKSVMESLSVNTLSDVIEISNKDLLANFKNLNLTEIVSLHNEFNNPLKPYEYDSDISTSSITWIDLKELLNYLAAIITIYMYWVYVSTTPPLEKKDLDKLFIRQQFQLEEKFKEQNKQINKIVSPKNKDLFYLTVRDNIVLRTNPYIKKSTAKARLDKNIQLLVLLRKDNWLNVEYFDEDNQVTQIGWVHIKNLKRVRKY